jgi:hypothetical protein
MDKIANILLMKRFIEAMPPYTKFQSEKRFKRFINKYNHAPDKTVLI